MPKNHTINIRLGAALAGSFKAAFSDGSKQLVRLGDGMKKLETRSKELNSFNKLRADVRKAGDKLAAAEKKVHGLRLAMQKTNKPSKQLRINLGRAQAAANKAKKALQKKRLELGQLRQNLKLTSIGSKQLATEQIKLGTSADKLRSKYKLLNDSIARRQRILSQRADLRGQAFDMIALGAAIGAPVKSAIDFESAMADVRKVIDFKEGKKGLDAFGHRLKELSREIPLTASELAAIAAAGGQLGTKEEDLEAFVNVVAKMSTAFDMSAEEAGESIGKIKNVFGLGMDDMESFGDTINHLSDNTAAKAKEIVQALLRVGGSAGDFGLKADSVAALADTFIALGKPPQQAGTAINALLVKLNTADKQSAKFQAGLAAMGLSASELKDHIAEDAEGALLSFLETVSKIDDQDRSGILFDLFGQEYVDDISLVAGNLDVYQKALATLADESKRAGSMQREFTNRADTTANKIKLFKNRVNELSISLSGGLLPGINLVLGAFGKVFTSIATVAKIFPTLTTVVFGTVFGLIALKIASIGLAYGWTFVTGGALLVQSALLKMRVAMLLSNVSFKAFNITALITATRLRALAFGGMINLFAKSLLSLATRAIPVVIGGLRILTIAMITNPIGLLVGGLALAGGLLISNWQKVRAYFVGFWKPVEAIWQRFADFIGSIWNVISTPLQTIGSLLDSFFENDAKVEAKVSHQNISSDSPSSSFGISSLPNGNTQSNSYHNNIHINIDGSERQSIKHIADEVIRSLREHSRGALFDQVSGVA